MDSPADPRLVPLEDMYVKIGIPLCLYLRRGTPPIYFSQSSPHTKPGDADESPPLDVIYVSGESENGHVALRSTVGGRLKRTFAMSGMAASYSRLMPDVHASQI